VLTWAELESKFLNLQVGGRYRPRNCTSHHRVAIIVPFRDRDIYLKIFLNNIHPLLQRQQLPTCKFRNLDSSSAHVNTAVLGVISPSTNRLIKISKMYIERKIFLNNIHPLLQRQQLDYGIYIVDLVSEKNNPLGFTPFSLLVEFLLFEHYFFCFN
jgi:hypothetical protein